MVSLLDYGSSSGQRRNDDVQFWDGALSIIGSAKKQSYCWRARCQHHGQDPECEHPTFRHVSVAGKSTGGRRNLSSNGSLDAYAVSSGYPCALESWLANRANCKYASPNELLHGKLRLWRGHSIFSSGSNDCNDRLTLSGASLFVS